MLLPKDHGAYDRDYLERGRAAAEKDHGRAFKKDYHPVTLEEIAGFVKSNYDSAAIRHMGYYASLMQAYLWRYGQHSIQVNPHSWLFETIPVDVRIPRPALNLVGDKVESVTAHLVNPAPRGSCRPLDASPINRRGARIADAYLKIKDETDEIDDLLRMVAETGTICGDAYVEVVVDESSARKVDVPMFQKVDMGDGEQLVPVVNGEGQPVMQSIRLADERCNLITPLQIMHNRTATGVTNATMSHSHCYKDMEWAKSMWPEHADEFAPASVATQAGQFQTRLQNLMLYDAARIGNSPGPFSPGDADFADDAVQMHVIRMNPDRYYEKGRYFVVAGEKCVMAGPLPMGELMLLHYRYQPVANSMLSFGMVKDLIEVNRWIEQMAHQAGMQRRTLGVPFILSPKGAGGPFSAPVLPMKYGGVYTYKARGGLKPEVIYPRGTMDAGMAKEMDLWLNDFLERIPGWRRVMEGERPQGVYAGVMLRQLISQGAGRFIPKKAAFHKFVEQLNVARLKAIAAAPASQLPRGITFPGKAGFSLWRKFQASDMGDNVTYKIEVSTGSQTDDATKIQDMMELIKLGVINPLVPKTQVAILRMVQLDDLVTELDPNVGKAEGENERMAAGDELHVGPYENDEIHLAIHVDWINHPDFELLDPGLQEMTLAHAKEHEDRITLRLMEAKARGELPSGRPSMNGAPVVPEAPVAPGQQAGNGMPGQNQAPAAQQAPAEMTA